jgi:biopolymer transport protein ExbD
MISLRRQRSSKPEINLAPLIDVMFLLIIFFVLSTTFDQYTHLSIQLPTTSAVPDAAVSTPAVVRLAIADDGQWWLDETLLPIAPTDSPEQQQARLRTALQDQLAIDKGSTQLEIYADAQVPHQQVMSALAVAHTLGVHQVTFITITEDRQSPSNTD